MQRIAAPRGPSSTSMQYALMFVVVWTALLPTFVADVPASASLLPGHTHATLGGFVPNHHHDSVTTDERACVAEGAQTDSAAVACGADGTVAVGTLLAGRSPSGVIAAAGIVVTAFEAGIEPISIAHILGTPPPRD